MAGTKKKTPYAMPVFRHSGHEHLALNFGIEKFNSLSVNDQKSYHKASQFISQRLHANDPNLSTMYVRAENLAREGKKTWMPKSNSPFAILVRNVMAYLKKTGKNDTAISQTAVPKKHRLQAA